MTFSQQQLAPSRSWKPCFQNPLGTYPIPNHLPTPRTIISHLSWARGSSSSCPFLSPCFNKTTILHQRHLRNSFLVVGSRPHPTRPHLYSKLHQEEYQEPAATRGSQGRICMHIPGLCLPGYATPGQSFHHPALKPGLLHLSHKKSGH